MPFYVAIVLVSFYIKFTIIISILLDYRPPPVLSSPCLWKTKRTTVAAAHI